MNTYQTDFLAAHPRGEAGFALVPIRRGTKQPYDPRNAAERAEDTAVGWSPTWGGTTRSPARWADYTTRAEAQANTDALALSLLRYRAGDDAAADADALAARLADLEAASPARGSAAWAEAAQLAQAVKRTPLTPAENARMTDLATLAALPPLNVAADVGLSRCIVIDADTTAEVSAWQAWAERLSGDPAWANTPLTVASPGVCDDDGQWRHRGGGHHWFVLPEDYTLPADVPGAVTVREGEGHFSIFTRDRYVLLPGSARPEGAYVVTGEPTVAPAWLLHALEAEAATRAAARSRVTAYRDRVEAGGGDGLSDELREKVEEWYAETPWADLLTPLGWTEAGWHDSCDCPIWSRPGGASPKSATAHEPGCSQHPNSLDPPIHFWTTEPGPAIEEKIAALPTGARSLSKLQLASALYCGGSDAAVLEVIAGRPLRREEVYLLVELSPGFGVVRAAREATPGAESVVVRAWRGEAIPAGWVNAPANANANAPAPATAPANALATAPANATATATATANAPANTPATAPANTPATAPATATANAHAPAPVESAPSRSAGSPVEGTIPTTTLALDTETYCDLDLSRHGVYRYAEDSSFAVLLVAYAAGDGDVQVVDLARGEELPDEIIAALLDDDTTKTAFNANFERVCLSRVLRDAGHLAEGTFLAPESWRCTMVHASVAGLPRGLGDAAAALGVTEKMAEGKDLIKRFSVPNKPRKNADTTHAEAVDDDLVRWLPESDLPAWERFATYCQRDVEVERAVRNALVGVPVTDQLWAEYAADQRINDRGIPIDLRVVDAADRVVAEHRTALAEEFDTLTGGISANSNNTVRAWLAERGYAVENTRKDTLARLRTRAEEAGDTDVARVLEIRPQLSSKSDSKYAAMRDYAGADDRARGTLTFHRAHTGRWSGKGVQPQNMTRTPAGVDAARDALLAGKAGLATAGALTRTALAPTPGRCFVAADYAQIEPRLLAYLAGEPAPLQAFQEGEDVYCVAAQAMYGKPVEKGGANAELRTYGKIATIACGYQMGSARLAMQNPDVSEDEAWEIVRRWRAANPRIVQFWSDLEHAARAVAAGAAPRTGYGLTLRSEPSPGTRGGRDLLIDLPSGRSLRYRRAAVEPQQTGPHAGQPALHFDSERSRTSTYGGTLVENVVQALGRDLIADAIVRAEAAGVNVIFSVHDEIVAEAARDDADETARVLSELMETPPAWLGGGLPLVAEAEKMDFYRK